MSKIMKKKKEMTLEKKFFVYIQAEIIKLTEIYKAKIHLWSLHFGPIFILVSNFFFFFESFNLQHRPLLMIAVYHQTKTPIGFWCRWGLNPRSLIQLSETLLVELIGTHLVSNLILRLSQFLKTKNHVYFGPYRQPTNRKIIRGRRIALLVDILLTWR